MGKMIDRPYFGEYMGTNTRLMSREELHDALIGELLSERAEHERRKHERDLMREIFERRLAMASTPWWRLFWPCT